MPGSTSHITNDAFDDDIPSYDATAQRLLNLVFVLNAARRPVRTAEIINDPDLGYGSAHRESDLRKFRRDRERLAQHGIIITEVRDAHASQTEESAWEIDRDRTFAAGGIINAHDAALLMDAIDEYTTWHATPLASPLRAVRRAAAEALAAIDGALPAPANPTEAIAAQPSSAGGSASSPSPSDQRVADALWTAFALGKQVSFTYTDARGGASARTLAIYGLFSHQGVPYVIGLDSASGDIRTFRVDRIDEITGLGTTYRVPDTFDVHDHLFLPFDLADGDPIVASFVFPAARTLPELHAITHRRGDLSCDDDQWTWRIMVRDLDAAAAYALAHARDGMRPLSPAALVHAWERTIEQVVSAHER